MWRRPPSAVLRAQHGDCFLILPFRSFSAQPSFTAIAIFPAKLSFAQRKTDAAKRAYNQTIVVPGGSVHECSAHVGGSAPQPIFRGAFTHAAGEGRTARQSGGPVA